MRPKRRAVTAEKYTLNFGTSPYGRIGKSPPSFWAILGTFWGPVTSQKGSKFNNFEILTSPSVFPPQKTYPYQFLHQNDHFTAFY